MAQTRRKRYKVYLEPGSDGCLPKRTKNWKQSLKNIKPPVKVPSTSLNEASRQMDIETLHYSSDSDIHSENCFSDSPSESCDNTDESFCDADDSAMNQPLEIMSKTTKFEILLMVLHFSMRHGLTGVAISDLIKMLNVLFGDSVLPETSYAFKKIFSYDLPISIHFYCSQCMVYLGKEEECKNLTICDVCHEVFSLTNMNNGNFFLFFSIESQMKELLKDKTFEEMLKYRHQREYQEDYISDIYDGLNYKTLLEKGIISASDLTATFATDGSSVYKSTKNSMWPIQFYINELPPTERYQPQNLMVAGLWFGKHHPSMETFFTPFVTEVQKLSNQGFSVMNSNTGHVMNVRLHFIACVCDSVAKSMLQCTKQFNGHFGCPYCLHPGDLVEGRFIKYSANNFPARTDVNIRDDMKLAHANNDVQRGVKGISPLFFLMYFDLVSGFVIDYMHACLLGVSKQLSNLWSDSANHNEEYYLDKTKVKKIDKRLLKIKPPQSISRRPRAFSDSIHWKANEWRSWTLYYSVICLKDVLPSTYFEHYNLYVSALFIMLKKRIHKVELDTAHMYLLDFVYKFEELYGAMSMTFNLHLLTHLKKCVLSSGPLWAYSAFPFEAGNGYLLKLVKGTRGVLQQIASKYITFKSIRSVVLKYNIENENVLSFCNSIMSYKILKKYSKIDGVSLMGKLQHFTPTDEEISILNDFCDNQIMCIKKVIFNGIMVMVKRIESSRKSNDSVVALNDGSYGLIERICVNIQDNTKIFFLIRLININQRSIICKDKCKHIKVCEPIVFGKLINATTENIKCKSILIDCGFGSFVTDFPNSYEKD